MGRLQRPSLCNRCLYDRRALLYIGLSICIIGLAVVIARFPYLLFLVLFVFLTFSVTASGLFLQKKLGNQTSRDPVPKRCALPPLSFPLSFFSQLSLIPSFLFPPHLSKLSVFNKTGALTVELAGPFRRDPNATIPSVYQLVLPF